MNSIVVILKVVGPRTFMFLKISVIYKVFSYWNVLFLMFNILIKYLIMQKISLLVGKPQKSLNLTISMQEPGGPKINLLL